VRHLRIVSIAITLIGVLLAAGSIALGLGALWTLIGLMLVVAGIVKIVTVAIWNGFAGLGPVKTNDDA
jgi:hypothetical protein